MHLLNLKGWSGGEIGDLIANALELKGDRETRSSAMKGRTLVLIFQKKSTRTRLSLEIGMFQLGGEAVYLDWSASNLSPDTLEDEIRCISRYADGIAARVNRHGDLERMASASSVPVINALCDLYHPCQILADLMTIKEKLGGWKGHKLAFVGDGNNVCNSLIIGCTAVGMEVAVAVPPGYEPLKDAVEIGEGRKLLRITHDPKEAVRGAHVVYTDTWVSQGQEEEREERMKAFPPYQVNEALLGKSGAIVMHCLPAYRGYEISDGVLDDPRAAVFDQAENRLHINKAIFLKLIK